MSDRPGRPRSGPPGGPADAEAPEAGRSPPDRPPAASWGLGAREVTAAAAVAAGLPAQGSLERESALHLYYLAAAAQATGRLTVGSERASYALGFKKGTLQHVAPSRPEEGVGPFLVQKGALGAEELARGEAARGRHGGDLVAALVADGLIDPSRTYQALQEHGAGLAWRALWTESGTWRWEPEVAPPPSSFPLGSRWGLLCEATRRLDAAGARRRLGSRAARAAVRTGGRVEASELKLTAQEARALGAFDGVRSVEEICAAQPADADLVHRVALLLAEAELLSFGPERRAAEAPRPGSRPPAAGPKAPPPARAEPGAGGRAGTPLPSARPAATPAPPPRPAVTPPPSARPAVTPPPKPPPAATPEALRAVLARIREADHFEALGVRREATAEQIKAAYFQLARSYHPDAAPPGDPPEANALRAEVFARMSEAWGVLGDDAERARYLERLASGTLGEVDVSAIFQAEQVFHTAVALVKSRKYEEARGKLDEAIGLNAEEPEFGVWRAWVAFLLAPPAEKKERQAESARVIEAELKKNPLCLPGYLFLGQMAKLVGDVAQAERQFKRGLGVDAANVELQRELRYLRK